MQWGRRSPLSMPLLCAVVVGWTILRTTTTTDAWVPPQATTRRPCPPYSRGPDAWRSFQSRCPAGATTVAMSSTDDSNGDKQKAYQEKFGWVQRIDSGKSLVVGAVVGSLAGAIPEGLHQLVLAPLFDLPQGPPLAQFEFDNDAAGLLTGLFAIVYRYGLRQDTDNPQLNQGLLAAFVVTRTLARVSVLPSYCTAIALTCGPPLGYLDWNVLAQLAVNGAESAVMYGATAWAMDRCMEKGWISRFPG